MLAIVMYHYVRKLENSRYPGIKALDLDLFKEQIDFFRQNFNIVTMEDVISYYDKGRKTLPDNSILLTFDDGYIDHYTNVFPILHKYKIQGSFFVPGKAIVEHRLLDVNKIHFILASADVSLLLNDLKKKIREYCDQGEKKWNIDQLYYQYAKPFRYDSADTIFIKRMLQGVLPEDIRNQISSELFEKYVGMPESMFANELYMSKDQLRLMKANGMYIGYHGYDHYWMNRLGIVELEKDINSELQSFSEFIDLEHWVCNYPYGSYSDEVIECLKRHHCCLGLSTDLGMVKASSDKYKLPRLDCNDFPPKSEAYKNY